MAAARVAVSTATRCAFHRCLAPTSALAPSGSYRQARPRPIAALSECAPEAFSVLEGRSPGRFPRPRVRRLQPCTAPHPSAPPSADAGGPGGLRPIPPHKDKEEP